MDFQRRRNLKIYDDVKAFKKEAAAVIISIVEKMIYCFVKTANVFDTVLMVSSTPIHLLSKMKKLLTSLVSLNVVSSNLAEKALPQYSELLSTLTQDPVENVKAFDYKES